MRCRRRGCACSAATWAPSRTSAAGSPIIGKSEEATRQLASRARRRVRGAESPPEPDIAAQCELVEAFLAASRNGDLEKIVAMLDPDVVAMLDGRPGIVVSSTPGHIMLLIRLAFADGRIAGIDVTGDPEKMRTTEIGVV